MAKDFSFPFYINNWIGGVMYYTFEQKGAYLELLLLQFNHGKFTETQVKQVLNICYSNVWPVIKEKFQTDGQFYWNERMEEVKNERKAYVESRRNNRLGKTKVTTKDEDMLIISKTYEKHMEGESKDKSKDTIPTESEFLTFAKETLMEKFNDYEFSLKAKFEAWVNDGWKDGNGKKIKNWKSKLKNTIPHLKPFGKKIEEKKVTASVSFAQSNFK